MVENDNDILEAPSEWNQSFPLVALKLYKGETNSFELGWYRDNKNRS